MSDEFNEDDRNHFSLTYSLDHGDYFRRACPSCGRHFKTKTSAADLVSAFQPAFKQQGMTIGLAHSDSEEAAGDIAPDYMYCPYCGYKAESSEMHTTAFIDYAKRYVMREVVLPQMNGMFSGLEDSFPKTSSAGLLSISMTFEHHKPILPPRPIAGPEPPDMLAVELLCCRKQAKILDGWRSPIVCPYCGNTCSLQ